MGKIVPKFEMFADAKARPLLLDFKRNYELVVSGLEASWAEIQDEKSKIGEITAELAKANEALLAAFSRGVHFVRRDAAAVGVEVCCPHCGASGRAAAFASVRRDNGSYLKCPNPQCSQTFQSARGQAGAVRANMSKD